MYDDHNVRILKSTVLVMTLISMSLVFLKLLLGNFQAVTAGAEVASASPSVVAAPAADGGGSGSGSGLTVLVWVLVAVVVVAGVLLAYWLGSRALERRRKVVAGRRARQAREDERRNRWQALGQRHSKIQDLWLDAEMDMVTTMLQRPALLDPTVRETSRLVEALERARRVAQEAGGQPPRDYLDGETYLEVTEYGQTVSALERAWRAADARARRIGPNHLSPTERKVLDDVQRVLAVATNDGASTSERQTAYRRARQLLGRITTVRVPDKALAAIETRARDLITAG